MPLRALALHYGADTVFTEEVVDRRVVNAVRTENPVLETVDYVEARGKKGTAIPFQTCRLERDRVVYQIGTGDATNALRAAQVGRCFYFYWIPVGVDRGRAKASIPLLVLMLGLTASFTDEFSAWWGDRLPTVCAASVSTGGSKFLCRVRLCIEHNSRMALLRSIAFTHWKLICRPSLLPYPRLFNRRVMEGSTSNVI